MLERKKQRQPSGEFFFVFGKGLGKKKQPKTQSIIKDRQNLVMRKYGSQTLKD